MAAWVRDLTARRQAFREKLEERQGLLVPDEDPDWGDVGEAFPAWQAPGRDAILHLWPDAGGLLAARTRPEELGTVYPHRWAVPREVWVRLFGSAEREIAILAYSALFLAEDAGILRILADKGRAGVTVRIALGDSDGANVAERGEEEGIGDAMPAKIRNALMLYRPLCAVENIEIRLHRTVLYNSIYCADDQLLVNQHAYGTPAAQAPVFSLDNTRGSSEMASLYLGSFERVWASSAPLA